MSGWWIAIELLGGMALLVAGAELTVRGAVRLAERFGMSPLTIGLTVVAFGTSSPELVVSLRAAAGGQSGISLGNVIGSNIFNVLLVLGACAAILPLTVGRRVIRLDIPVMIGVSCLAWALALNHWIGRAEGLILVAGLIGYTAWQLRLGWREGPDPGTTEPAAASAAASADDARGITAPAPGSEADAETSPDADRSRPGGSWPIAALLVLAGLGLMVLGGQGVVVGASTLARGWGISELVIGLTVVAVGTSLPEAATSLVASFRGQRDMAVGNIVGSNVFNLLGIAGLAALLSPMAVDEQALRLDLPVMTAVAVACLPIAFTGCRIARWEGVFFLACYIGYTGYLVLTVTWPGVAGSFGTAMLALVVPIVGVTLGVLAVRAFRRPRDGGG